MDSSKLGDKLEIGSDYKAFANPFSYRSTVKLDGTNYEYGRAIVMSVEGHGENHIIEENEPEIKFGKILNGEGRQ